MKNGSSSEGTGTKSNKVTGEILGTELFIKNIVLCYQSTWVNVYRVTGIQWNILYFEITAVSIRVLKKGMTYE